MKRLALLAALPAAALLLAAAPGEMPALRLFGGFSAGQWQVKPYDADSRARQPKGEAQCLSAPEMIVHAGHESANGGGCQHTIIQDTADRAIVTYVCKGQGYGRTDIRRESDGSYIVESQGIAGRDPFEMKGHFMRTGDCKR